MSKRTNKISSQVMKLAHSIKAQFATFSQALKAAWDKWHKSQTVERKLALLKKMSAKGLVSLWTKKGVRYYVNDNIYFDVAKTGFSCKNAYFDVEKLKKLGLDAVVNLRDFFVVIGLHDYKTGRAINCKKQERIVIDFIFEQLNKELA